MRPTCLLVSLSFLFLALVPVQAGHRAPGIFLRVHVQTTGEGLSAQQAETITLPTDGEKIQIRALPEISEHNLIDIKTDPSGSIRLFFDHDGTVSLSAVTAQNQGRLLVVLINGTVVYAPTIDVQISTGELDLPYPLPPEVLQLLQQTAKANAKEEASR